MTQEKFRRPLSTAQAQAIHQLRCMGARPPGAHGSSVALLSDLFGGAGIRDYQQNDPGWVAEKCVYHALGRTLSI